MSGEISPKAFLFTKAKRATEMIALFLLKIMVIREGLEPSTQSSALKQAVKWKMLMQNPCDFCDLPRQVRSEMKCFTPDETNLFLETAKSDKFYALFCSAIETGMRPEEYIGLQWKDIDFEQKVLSVQRAVVEKKGGGFIFDELKTSRSRRSIPLSNMVINVLKIHRRNQLEERLKLGAAYQNFDLVFASEVGTPIMRRNLLRGISNLCFQKQAYQTYGFTICDTPQPLYYFRLD